MGDLRVDFIGTGTALSAADRYGSATLLRTEALTLLVDAGPGSLKTLARFGVSAHDLDALLITHAHLDHFAELLPLLFALSVPGYERNAPLPILLSEPAAAYLDDVRGVFGKWVAARGQAHVRTLRAGSSYTLAREEGPGRGVVVREDMSQASEDTLCTLETFDVKHTESSLGYRLRFAAGPKVVLPGDTGYFPELFGELTDADLLILECAVDERDGVPTHLNPKEFVEVVRSASPRAAALVHRYPQLMGRDLSREFRTVLPLPVLAPRDGSSVEIDASGTIFWRSDGTRAAESVRIAPGAGWYE